MHVSWHLLHRPEDADFELMRIVLHGVVHNTKGAFCVCLRVSNPQEQGRELIMFDLPVPLVYVGDWRSFNTPITLTSDPALISPFERFRIFSIVVNPVGNGISSVGSMLMVLSLSELLDCASDRGLESRKEFVIYLPCD